MFRIKYSREVVLKLLYQIDILGLREFDIEAIIQNNLTILKGINDFEKEFVIRIITKFQQDKEKIDSLISKQLIGWKFERLTPVDRNLLRMGICESYFNDQKAIIIDDVIRIAKKYGGKDSYKIINAILDKIVQ